MTVEDHLATVRTSYDAVAESYFEGFPADRSGGACGVRHIRVGMGGRRTLGSRTIRGCHSYQAPQVVEIAGRVLVVWEHEDRHVATAVVMPARWHAMTSV